jgi:hypothetical protein
MLVSPFGPSQAATFGAVGSTIPSGYNPLPALGLTR